MALGDVIGGQLTITNGGSATVTPGAGERWVVTFLRSGYPSSNQNMPQSGYGPKFTIGVSANDSTNVPVGSIDAGTSGISAIEGGGPKGPLFLDASRYLSIAGPNNNGSTWLVTYSGVKLN